MRVWRSGTIYLDVIKSAANSASVAEEITNLIIWAMAITGSLKRGIGSFSERMMWAPERLQTRLTLR